MQQRTRTAQESEASSAAPFEALLPDAAWVLEIQRTWLDGMKSLVVNSPLSGDVTQWIRAWSEVVGQVGLVNVNYAGSRDVQAERRITGRYSYGSQLGRIMELLVPYVTKHEKDFTDPSHPDAVKDFLKMANEIGELKQASVEDVVEKVRQWEKAGSLDTKLPLLIARLQQIQAAPRKK